MAHLVSFTLICAFLSPHILSLHAHRTKLSLRLIHPHSIIRHSLTSIDDDIRAPVTPMEDRSLFLVNISIGEPPVPQLLAMDTGSDVVWVRRTQCDGCTNIFDPKKSSTFSKLPSDSPQCVQFTHQEPYPPSGQCSYNITYEDHSSCSGYLALEKFTLVTSSGSTSALANSVLGCALATAGSMPPYWNGILGLEAPSEYHFVSRTGNRFSYCIGNITDIDYMYNQLILGDGAIFQGDSTPMKIKGNHYVVSLEGISVGDKQLTINTQEFYYNVIIDSGSTYTALVRSAYEPLVAEVRRLVEGVVKPVGEGDENQVCYGGDLERDLKGFPVVRLQLAGGAEIELDVEGVFRRTRSGTAFCMAIVESEKNNIIGVMAQQYYNVGFDLDARRISFQRIECQLLED